MCAILSSSFPTKSESRITFLAVHNLLSLEIAEIQLIVQHEDCDHFACDPVGLLR